MMVDNLKEQTLKRLDGDDKYQKVLSSVDEETRKRIDQIVRGFISDLADGLEKLKDPEVAKKLAGLRKNGR